MKPYSITRRLIFTVLLIELFAALGVSAFAYLYERHAHLRAFDVLLRGRADSLLGAVQDAEDAADNVMLDGSEVTSPRDDVYQVTDDRGRVLGHSPNWNGLTSKDILELVDEDGPGTVTERYYRTQVEGKAFRVLQIQGYRVVDPGDKTGGIRRTVTIEYGSPEKRVWHAILRAVGFYAMSSVGVLAATGLLMSWLLNRGLAPLRELASSAAQVSVNSWTFTPPQQARMTRELAPLVTALESVLEGLQSSFEQQSRFVGDAAHELKTGVAVVKSSLQLLGMKHRSVAEYEAGLERSLSDCERMEEIVAQMLTLARLEERSTNRFSAVPVDVLECVSESARKLGTMAELRGISISIRGCSGLLALADPEQLELLVTNLLINALQHSLAGTEITVETLRLPGKAEMRFSDHGEGIAPEDLPRIFERFSRGDPSRSRKTGGTGLGLAICKAIAERFHGSISIESQLRAGTTVVVQLPLDHAIAENPARKN